MSSRLTKDDTEMAEYCKVGQDRNCNYQQYDVVINKCSGRRSCNVTLTDRSTCYDAFIMVKYSCISDKYINKQCEVKHVYLENGNGYIRSPNYPNAYYSKALCNWLISVKKRQYIIIKFYDFRLNPHVENKCGDVLRLSQFSGGQSVGRIYKLCSLMGFRTIRFMSQQVLIEFESSSATISKAGFFLEYRAVGPGCDDLESLGNHTDVIYIQSPRAPQDSYLGDSLIAEVKCHPGYFTFVDNGDSVSSIQLSCVGNNWQHVISPCTDVLPIPTTPRKPGEISDDKNYQTTDHNASYIGTILGIVCSVVSLLLIFAIVVYILRRRKKSTRKRDDWAKVNNEMQYSNQINEARVQSSNHHYYTPSKCGSLNPKVYNYDYNNINTCDEDNNCQLQYYDRTPQHCNNCDSVSQCGSLVGHAAGIPSNCICRRSSATDLFDDNTVGCETPPSATGWQDTIPYTNSCSHHRVQPRIRPLRERRTKSGQWNRSTCNGHTNPTKRSRSCEILDQRRSLSTSAPDLLNEVEVIQTSAGQSFTSFHTPRKLFY